MKIFIMKKLCVVIFFTLSCLPITSFTNNETLINEWGIEFVEIPAGSFNMGLEDAWDVRNG